MGALPADEAIKTFRIADGFRIELVACEPDVIDPVALTWDEDGRLYVVEMGDYPTGPAAGRVKLLEDTNGDGKIDRSILFADKLSFPTGVFPWRGGILVTAAPDILYLKDTDGDGKADVRRVLFKGFIPGNPQHRVNGLVWGMDNWIYGANGDSGGVITTPTQSPPSEGGARGGPERRRVAIGGRDFRIRPDELLIEPVSGMSQFGISFDDWGRRFICNNRVHIRLVMLPEHYLKRNPHLRVGAVAADIAEYGPVGGRVYPISQLQERFNDFDHGNHFTSACGLHIYRGGLFPRPYERSAFVCEPVHNLIHGCTLTPNGPGLAAKRIEKQSEFLASTDPWFRPVFLATGPDGALYIADFYRAVLEHPQWIPLKVQKRLDLRAGSDRGRIYRVVPKTGAPSSTPTLSKLSSAALVEKLAHSNAWWCDTAQRLLIERTDKSVVPSLQKMAMTHDKPQARMRALWTLDGLAELSADNVIAALSDRHPRVREQALRLSERWLATSDSVRNAVLALAEDADVGVQFQLAFTLGACSDPRALDALARIAEKQAADPWFRTAILSSIAQTAPKFAEMLFKRDSTFFKERTPGRLQFVREFAGLIGARGDAEQVNAILTLFFEIDDPHWRLAALAGLAQGSRSGKSLLAAAKGGRLKAMLEQAERVATKETEPIETRVEAIRLLALEESASANAALGQLLDSRQPQQVQMAAVQTLSRRREPQVALTLLHGWRSYSPAVRREVLEAIFRQRDRLPHLLNALAAGTVLAADLEPRWQTQLLSRLSGDQLQRAKSLLGEGRVSDRRKIVEAYRDVLKLPRDVGRGRALFQKHCAACHRFNGEGTAVGPDLADVRTRPEESLLEDILDPNRAFSPGYVSYILETTSGQVFQGVLAVEGATTVTLRRAEGIEDAILRTDIAALQSTGQSLMPEGVERSLSRQEIADVLAYLKAPVAATGK